MEKLSVLIEYKEEILVKNPEILCIGIQSRETSNVFKFGLIWMREISQQNFGFEKNLSAVKEKKAFSLKDFCSTKWRIFFLLWNCSKIYVLTQPKKRENFFLKVGSIFFLSQSSVCWGFAIRSKKINLLFQLLNSSN